jgi:hypothetical protein
MVLISLAIFALIDQVVHITHGEGLLARVPGGYAFLAAIGSLGLALIARLVSAVFERKQDYYAPGIDDD